MLEDKKVADNIIYKEKIATRYIANEITRLDKIIWFSIIMDIMLVVICLMFNYSKNILFYMGNGVLVIVIIIMIINGVLLSYLTEEKKIFRKKTCNRLNNYLTL